MDKLSSSELRTSTKLHPRTLLTYLPRQDKGKARQGKPKHNLTYKRHFCIRSVVVSWFVFHVLQLLPIRFTQQSLCYISNSMLKHLQKSD